MMEKYLQKTRLLDYDNDRIQNLIANKKWNILSEKEKIIAIYNYVRDEVLFGYNFDDNIKASQVLIDGYGQCNTKGTLFMALLRATKIPCRIHGFTIDKKLQKGAMKGIYYRLAPKEIVHSWVEILYNSKWYNVEGFILDVMFLQKLQDKFSNCTGSFCGYGVATTNFKNPPIYWDENDTYIQKEGIVKDFGIYNSPDELFSQHYQALSLVKKVIYQKLVRHLMNRNISIIRNSTYSN